MNKALLEIINLKKTYGSQTVFSQLSMRLQAGEIVAITGPSGCGKTTLLNLIAGLDEADCGEIYVAGQSLSQLSEENRTLLRRQSIGFIFQFFNLIPTLTVLENCCIPLELNAKETRKDTIIHQLAAVGLADKLQHFPEQLSGGEQQRVALIRALAHEPRLILADEPTGNLDQLTANSISDFLFEEIRQRQCALIVVTHSETLASKADRILHLHNGQFLTQ